MVLVLKDDLPLLVIPLILLVVPLLIPLVMTLLVLLWASLFWILFEWEIMLDNMKSSPQLETQ
jgi:hypothetical protein